VNSCANIAKVNIQKYLRLERVAIAIGICAKIVGQKLIKPFMDFAE
jgi:hypothetical protein